MALMSRPRWGNVAAGGAIAIACGAILVSMVRLGRTTPLVLLAGLGLPLGVVLALTRDLRCRGCAIPADEGVVPVSSATGSALKDALARKDTDEVARLLEAPTEPPYLVVRYGYCRGCRQAARLSWKGRHTVDVEGPVAGPVVAALEERRRMLRSGV
jgi:hypothetical protein